jgi:LysM repeat protein
MGGTATDNTSSALNNNNGSVQVGDVRQTAVVGVPTEITTNLARVKQIITAISEGIRFKSRIGHALLESFDLKLNEDAASDLAELNKIWPVCVNWAKDPKNASTDVAKEIETLAPQVTTWVGKAQSNTRIGTGGTSSSATDNTSSALNNNNGAAGAGRNDLSKLSADGTTVIGSASQARQKDNEIAAAATAEKKKETVLPQAVTDLAAANKIDNANSISVGQVITLADGITKYTIVKGDTLADIAAGKFKGVDPTKPAATTSASPTTITVRKGDTLTSIAKNSTPPMVLADLIKANPGIDPKKLKIGQTLNLPTGTKAGILPADSAPKEAPAIPKITDVPPMPDLPEPPPPKRETGVIGTLTDDPTYQNWLRKNVKGTKVDDLYWVNGERYEATLKRGRLTWVKDQPFGNAERTAQLRNYTGPDSGADAFAKEQQKIWSAAQQARIQGKVKESTGFANEELNRILSLVHHR